MTENLNNASQKHVEDGQLPSGKRQRGRSVSVGDENFDRSVFNTKNRSNNDLLKALSSLSKDITDTINTKQSEVITAMNGMRDGLMEYVNTVKQELNDKIVSLKTEVMPEVQSLNKVAVDRIIEAEKLIPAVESRLDKLERQALAKEIVITGIPCQNRENLVELVNSICKAVGFQSSNDIENCFRIPSKGKRLADTPIIVKFWSMNVKHCFMEGYYKKQNLNLQDIGFNTAQRRIFINESLTPKNREIFAIAQRMKRERKISLARTRSGLVFITLNGRSSPMCIVDKEQLLSVTEQSQESVNMERNDGNI